MCGINEDKQWLQKQKLYLQMLEIRLEILSIIQIYTDCDSKNIELTSQYRNSSRNENGERVLSKSIVTKCVLNRQKNLEIWLKIYAFLAK
jgi:hypothetical protein